MDLPWGGLEREAVGAWERLAAEVRAWDGTAIISHEILGTASRVQVARALESLDGTGDTEIHVVMSARDLVRQIPAEWQENVKHRRTMTYAAFLEQLRDPTRGSRDRPVVLGRAGGARRARPLGRHPPPRARPPGHRAAARRAAAAAVGAVRRAVRADPERYAPTDRANASLGVPESTMIRRLNLRVREVLPNHHYRTFVREMLVHRHLSGRAGSPRLRAARGRLPVGRRPQPLVGQRPRPAGVRRGRRPRRPAAPASPRRYVDPDACDEGQVADAALDALGDHDPRDRPAARRRDRAARRDRRPDGPARPVPRRALLQGQGAAGRDVAHQCRGPGGARRSTGGCGAAARARRSARSARWRTRRCPRPTMPPTTGTRRPTVVAIRLPAILVTSSVATSLAITWSRWGSCTGAVASAIGVPGSFFLRISASIRSSPSSEARMALRVRLSSRS